MVLRVVACAAYASILACSQQTPSTSEHSPGARIRHMQVPPPALDTLPVVAGIAVGPDGQVAVTGSVFMGRNAGNDLFAVVISKSGDFWLDHRGAWPRADFGTPTEGGVTLAFDDSGRLLVASRFGDYTSDGTTAVARFLPDGRLDDSFAQRGLSWFAAAPRDLSHHEEIPRATFVDSENRTTVLIEAELAGSCGFAVARLDAQGELDTTFGTNGTTYLSLTYNWCGLKTGHRQADGGIVAAGYWHDSFVGDFSAIVRFDANGALDANFGTEGLISYAGTTHAHAASTQSNGRILALLQVDLTTAKLMALRTDGSLDLSFGDAGFASVGGEQTGWGAPFVQDDDTILVWHSTGLLRLTADGNVDPSFMTVARPITTGYQHLGTDGSVLSAKIVADEAHGVPVLTLTAFNSRGAPDLSYGQTGIVEVPGTFVGHSAGYDLLLDDRATITVVGTASNVGSYYPALLAGRLDEEYRPTPDFADNGWALTQVFNDGTATLSGVAQGADSSIISVGTTSRDIVLVRYLSDGSPDLGFGHNGLVVIDHHAQQDRGLAVSVLDDSRILVAARSDTDTIVIRLLPSGERDLSFGEGGSTHLSQGGSLPGTTLAMMHSPGGRIYIAGESDESFFLAALDSDGRPESGFGRDGQVLTPLNGYRRQSGGLSTARSGALLGALAIDKQHRPIIVGSTFNGFNDDAVFVRYAPNGVLDETFGAAGILTIDLDGGEENLWDLVVGPQGRIIAVGARHEMLFSDVLLIALTDRGEMHEDFGNSGVVLDTYEFNRQAAHAVVQTTEDTLLVTGEAHGQLFIAEYAQ